MPDFPAPTAHQQELLQMVQAFQQPLGRQGHPEPDGQLDGRSPQNPGPVEAGGIAIEQVGQLDDLDHPVEPDDKEEANGFLPQDGFDVFSGGGHVFGIRLSHAGVGASCHVARSKRRRSRRWSGAKRQRVARE